MSFPPFRYLLKTPPPLYSWDKKKVEKTDGGGDVAATKPDPVIKDMDGEIINRASGSCNGSDLSISNLTNSTLIVTDHIGGAIIDDCINSTIMLGVSSESVFIRDCKNCKIFTINPQFRLRDCENLEISLFCNSTPALENCRNVKLSPWEYTYAGINSDLKESGMTQVFNNTWYSVHDFTKVGTNSVHQEQVYSFRPSIEVPKELEGILERNSAFSRIPVVLGSLAAKDFDTYALCFQFENRDHRDRLQTKITKSISELTIFRSWECKISQCELPSGFDASFGSDTYLIFLEVCSETSFNVPPGGGCGFNFSEGSSEDARFFFTTRNIL